MVNDDQGKNSSSAGGGIRRDRKDWPAQWFAQDAVARLVVGRNLKILAINTRAAAMVEQSDGLAIREGVLVGRDRRIAGELTAAVGEAG